MHEDSIGTLHLELASLSLECSCLRAIGIQLFAKLGNKLPYCHKGVFIGICERHCTVKQRLVESVMENQTFSRISVSAEPLLPVRLFLQIIITVPSANSCIRSQDFDFQTECQFSSFLTPPCFCHILVIPNIEDQTNGT